MESLRWLWQQIHPSRAKFIMAMILCAVATPLSLIAAFLTPTIIEDLIPNKDLRGLIIVLLILTGIVFIKTCMRYLFVNMFEKVSQRFLFDVRGRMYDKIQRMDFEFFDKNRTGDLMARMTGDIESIRDFLARVVFLVIEQSLTFIIAVVMLFVLNAKLAAIMVVMCPVIAVLAVKLSSTIRPAFQEVREQFSKLNTVVQENISGNRVVKAFAKESYEMEKFEVENDAYRDLNLKASDVWANFLPKIELINSLIFVAMIIVGGWFVIDGQMTIGVLAGFNAYLWAISGPMSMVGPLALDIQRFFTNTDKVVYLSNVESDINIDEDRKVKREISGKVEFENVSFGYRDNSILKNISFAVKPGETIGIIGPTGSGKSTLVNLIPRFYDVSSGKIKIDGVDVKQIELQHLRKHISMSMQDIFLFSDTIEGNIVYGSPEAPFEDAVESAKLAAADEFIVKCSDGYDTIIGERGVGLSGGQKQRISLARAIIVDPTILILDDTTSSVDIETEKRIHNDLKDLYNEKTTFIIAHRISSIMNADKILVLADGEIIENGTHNELLEKKGNYYNIFMNQHGDSYTEVEEEEVL